MNLRMLTRFTALRSAHVLLAVVLLSIAGLYGARRAVGASPVYPPSTPAQRVIFSHAQHSARGTQCVACHTRATASLSAVDNLLPTEKECRACHAIDRSKPAGSASPGPVTACIGCHRDWQAAMVVVPRYAAPAALKFNHQQHAQTGCVRCHGDMTRTLPLPSMDSCLSCHATAATPAQPIATSARTACTRCHLSDATGGLQTELPDGALVPTSDTFGDQHGPGFATDHTRAARQPNRTCGSCHRESYCSDCHNGVSKPLEFHVGNYLSVHATEARRGSPDCSACHRAATFCVACHERSGVGTRGAPAFGTGDGQRAFHPFGWAGGLGAANLHAGEARRNLAACASCHRDNDCIRCHSAEAGGMKASPHPRGWRNSAQCEALDRGNRRMCLRCHVSASEVGCNWSAAP